MSFGGGTVTCPIATVAPNPTHAPTTIAAALTLTGRSADRLLWMASGFVRLADVHAALERGHIDWAKACVFVTELAVLADDELASADVQRD